MDQDPTGSPSPELDFKRGSALLLCGAAVLFWELVLIRWLGSCVRIVAYYSNFVLVAAFFGLGVGALLARRKIRLNRLVFVAISAANRSGPAPRVPRISCAVSRAETRRWSAACWPR